MCVVCFTIGVWLGEAYVLSFEASVSYNPFVYYQMMSIMQNSPFMWATPELWYQLKDSKSEFAAGVITAMVAGSAYSIVGPAAAIKCLGFGATKSRLAAKALKMFNNSSEPARDSNTITVAGSNDVEDRTDSGAVITVR